MLYPIKNSKAISNLAEEKIKYVKLRQTKQSKISLINADIFKIKKEIKY